MSGLRRSRGSNLLRYAPPRATAANNQGPPHGTSPLMGPVTAQSYPYGQGTVHPGNNNSLVQAAIRATAALDNVIPIVEDAQNDARQQQRERHNTQLHLEDAELAAGAMLVEMSRRTPLAPAPPAPEPATGHRVADLANEEPIPLSGRRMSASDIVRADRMEEGRKSRDKFRAQIKALNGHIDDYETALEERSIEKEEAYSRLDLEMEDWKHLRAAIDASTCPKRELDHSITSVLLRLKKIGDELPKMDQGSKSVERVPRKVTKPPSPEPELRRPEPSNSHYVLSPTSSPKRHLFDLPPSFPMRNQSYTIPERDPRRMAKPPSPKSQLSRPEPSSTRHALAPTSSPTPTKRHPFDLPPKISTKAATSAQGCSVQQTLQVPTSIPTMQQRFDRPIADPITSPSPLGHGDQARQAGRRIAEGFSVEDKLKLYYSMASLDTEMVGDPEEETYRRDVFQRIFGEHATYVPIDILQVDDVHNEDISMRSDFSVSDLDMADVSEVCNEDLWMGDIPSFPTDNLTIDPNTTRLDAPIDMGNAVVQTAPTPTPQYYPMQMEDEEWVYAPSKPTNGIKRSYKDHSFHGYREQDLQLSAGHPVKRAKRTIGACTIYDKPARYRAYLTNDATLEMPVVSSPAPCEPAPAVHVPAEEVQVVVSSPAPCEPAPTVPVVAPSEAVSSVSALSEPTLAVEETTESVMTEEQVREESAESEEVQTPFVNEVSELPSLIPSFPPTSGQFVSTVTEEVVDSPAPSEPVQTESVLTLPTPTEEVVGTAPMEQTPAESDLAEPVEAKEVQSMPGSYPATLEELVLPWMWCSETVVSAPAVTEPAPTVEEKVMEESSSNEEEPVAKEINVVQDVMDHPGPRESVRPRQRRSNGISHLERILAMCPESNYGLSEAELVASADSHAQNSERVRINVSPLVSIFSGPVPSVDEDAKGTDSCAEESEEKEAEPAHSAQKVAKEQRASPEGSMDPTSDISPSETETTPGPAVNAPNGYEVRSMGLALLNGLYTGLWLIGVMLSAMVVVFCVFVLCGGHLNTFAHVMAGTDRVLEELRAGHGPEISFMDRIVYMVMCWFAGDRMLPG